MFTYRVNKTSKVISLLLEGCKYFLFIARHHIEEEISRILLTLEALSDIRLLNLVFYRDILDRLSFLKIAIEQDSLKLLLVVDETLFTQVVSSLDDRIQIYLIRLILAHRHG